jgi:hypothetical protein
MATLPFPTSNNAPQPIPGGYGNPTGSNNSILGGGQPFPFLPRTGGYTATPAYNAGPWSAGAMGGLSSGLFSNNTPYQQNFYNMLGKAYGKGGGQILGDILKNGLFNPQVAAAMLNAQQPGIARGMADIQGSFGDAGARFSSAAGLGLGDYQSQVQLNQQATLAQMFEQSQQSELALLQSVLPTVHQERADQGGILHDILGGLEIAGGIAAAPFTGGMSLGLVGSGIGTLTGGGNKGSMGGGGGLMNMPGGSLGGLFETPLANKMFGWGQSTPTVPQSMYDELLQSTSAGSALGGTDPSQQPFPYMQF